MRPASAPAAALGIDRALPGDTPRAAMLEAACTCGDLRLAEDSAGAHGFLGLNPQLFVHTAFVALLVHPSVRRRGASSALLDAFEATTPARLWRATNRSNAPMAALLRARDWVLAGEIAGLDPGDPALFFRSS